MRRFFRLFLWPVAKWDQWRINRWLGGRQDGKSNEEALKSAWMSAGRAYRVLMCSLGVNIAGVGVLRYGGGRLSPVASLDQTAVLMAALALLYPALPPANQKTVLDLFVKGLDHDWGYVRRAAQTALNILERDGHYTSTTVA